MSMEIARSGADGATHARDSEKERDGGKLMDNVTDMHKVLRCKSEEDERPVVAALLHKSHDESTKADNGM
jgi:hypothetical protein